MDRQYFASISFLTFVALFTASCAGAPARKRFGMENPPPAESSNSTDPVAAVIKDAAQDQPQGEAVAETEGEEVAVEAEEDDEVTAEIESTVAPAPEEAFVPNKEVEKEILEADQEILTSNDVERSSEDQPRKNSIPIEVNRNVQKWIHYFTVKDKERFNRFLKRGAEYKELVQSILKEHGVPVELYYLAMIESGYVTHARSRASAVGPWQFIRGTGKRYGLKQNYYLDERRDIVRATEAAARYLSGLHTAFQSWYLAMAGYNAGEGRILGAIMRGNSRNFWDLVEKKALPSETRNYVPKFLAAVIIGKDPEKYDFTDVKAENPFPAVESAEVTGGVKLSTIAKKIDMSNEELYRLNPHLRRKMTPSSEKAYAIWVPKGKADKVKESADYFAKNKVSASRSYASSSGTSYRVRRGDTLGKIARRHGTSISNLKRINNLRSNRIQVGQRLQVQGKVVIHRVQQGDALIHISKRYGVPVWRIKKANALKSSRIYVGQHLKIKTDI